MATKDSSIARITTTLLREIHPRKRLTTLSDANKFNAALSRFGASFPGTARRAEREGDREGRGHGEQAALHHEAGAGQKAETIQCFRKWRHPMARIEGLGGKKASPVSKVLFWAARRRLGRVSETWEVTAHVPRLHLGRGIFDLLLDSSHQVPHRLRRLANVKTAMLIGCRA